MVLDEPINGVSFQANLQEDLVRELGPRDIVIFNNLVSDNGTRARAAIEAAGAMLLYPPRCKPDFIPTENAFSTLAALLLRAMERTIHGLRRSISAAFPAVTPHQCANLFAAAGYEPD